MPACRPLTQTVVRQSLAPKFSWTRRPLQPAGTVTVRRYHSLSSWVILRWTPERADSATNGTRICCGQAVGWPASAEVTAKSQRPLRFSQSERVSWGRGYSGNGWSTGTWAVQGVVMGEGFGVQAAACAAALPAEASAATHSRARAVNRAAAVERRVRGRAVCGSGCGDEPMGCSSGAVGAER